MRHSAGQGGGQHITEVGGLAPEQLLEGGVDDGERRGDPVQAPLLAAIATAEPAPRAAGPVPVANALRAEIPVLTMLSDGERHVLAEWLDRIVTATGCGSGW
jgi:hypothetical protein